MDFLSHLIANPWIALPLIGLSAGTVVYLWFDKIYSRVRGSASSTQSEMIKLLDQMHVQVKPAHVGFIQYGCSFGLGLAFFLLLWPRASLGLTVGLAITYGMWTVPLRVLQYQWNRRNALFVAQMVDGLTIMGNGVKAGLGVAQSMERVVENMPNPISQEFRLTLSQQRLGRSLEEALTELGERIPKPDVQMFVTSVNILNETGGNMAETFSTIVLTIRERQKVEGKIEAMTAQGIMQGFIVSMVPLGIIGLLYMLDPGYIQPMFNSTLGIVLLIIMFGLIIIGGVTIRKVVTIKV